MQTQFLDKTVTVIRNTKTPNPQDFIYTPFSNVVNRIKTGANGLDMLSATAQVLKSKDVKEYRDWKAKALPAVIPAGVFDQFENDTASHGYAAWNGQHTGFVVPDFDNVDDLPALLEKLKALPYVFFLFSSPSAVGCKPFICLDPLPKDRDEHKIAWEYLKTEIEDAVGYQLTIDKQCKNLNRLCYLAYDPDCYINEAAEPFKWSNTRPNPSPKPKPRPTETDAADQAKEVLRYLSADDREDWVNVGHAVKHEGLPFSMWDEWSRTSANHDASEDMQARWDGFKPDGGITWGSVVYRAKENGYKTPAGQTKKKKAKAESAPESAPDMPDSPFFNGKKFLPMGMQDFLLNEGLHFVSLPSEPGLRVYQDGLYIHETQADKEHRLLPAMQKYLGGQTFKMSQYDEVKRMLLETITPLSQCEPSGYLNHKKGILNLNTFESKPHNPEQVFLSQLPVAFDPNADCPFISEWLADVLEGDDDQVKLFLESIGYTLLQTTELQKMFILLGPTQTGKSTAGNLLRALVGDPNCSSLSLRAIDDEDNRFSRASLLGKIANISADISHRYLQGDGNIKRITAGESIDAEFKGKDRFEFEPNVTLWAMANRMPASRDKSSGWYQRLMIIEFKKQFLSGTDNPPDTSIIDKLTTETELSGLLNVALVCGKNALDRAGFAITQKQTDALQTVMELNDHVYGFCQFVESQMREQWQDAHFYSAYCEWLADEDSETKPLSKRKLAEAVKTHGLARKRAVSQSGERYFVWERS